MGTVARVRYTKSMEIGTVQNYKGQGGVQSHATRGARTLCGRTPDEKSWDAIEPVTLRRLSNVSCNRCRTIMGTLVNTDQIEAAAQRFLDSQEV